MNKMSVFIREYDKKNRKCALIIWSNNFKLKWQFYRKNWKFG